jgi:hypothetical protein
VDIRHPKQNTPLLPTERAGSDGVYYHLALILEWLNDVLATTPARMRGGQFGYLTVQETNITVWNDHTFNATAARASAEACQPRRKEVCAGWLPWRAFAETWL